MIDVGEFSFTELKKKIKEELNLSDFIIKYKDQEGELITIKKDKDLIRASKNQKCYLF